MERTWAMTKLRTGDWALPSNSGKTLWRICRNPNDGAPGGWAWDLYWFEGPANAVYAGEVPEGAPEYVDIDFDDWSRFSLAGQALPTRQAAIDEALRLGDA